MKCQVCKKRFREGEMILPIMKYVANEKRGDFVSSPVAYAHLSHLITKEHNETKSNSR